jgi:small subunit ribosomal protein S17
MAEKEKKAKTEKKETTSCTDIKCPFHGKLSLRGRTFRGTVVKKLPKRVSIVFERTVYIKKYERYAKKKTKLHARLPDCLESSVQVGDYIEIKECRPLSKIINFVVIKKIRGKEVKEGGK